MIRTEIGFRGCLGDAERGHAAPEIVRVGEFFEPDFFRKKDLGFDGSVGVAGVAPASELVVLDDVLKKCRVEQEDADEFATNARSAPRFDEGIGEVWLAKLEGLGIEVGIIGINRNAHALAAEHEPEDAEFPILETVDVRVRVGVEIEERARGD